MWIRSSLLAPLFAAALSAAFDIDAKTIEVARAAFDDGRFVEAAEMAEALGTSQALTLASAALTQHGYHIAERGEEQMYYERAMELGERAVGLDPDNAVGHLRWGQAMGRYAKTIGVVKAFRQGYGGRIREAFEAALALDPDMAEAHISLGVWHVEGIKEGGFMARMALGASRKTGTHHYERGLELDPESKTVVYEYARGLSMLNKRKNRSRAREAYTRALELPARNAADRLLDLKTESKLAKLGG